MDVARRFATSRNVEVAPARRAAADEDRIVAFADQAREAVDATFGDKLAAGRQSVADLFVDHLVGQAKLRESGCASCRRRANRNRTRRPRSRSRPDRAQPSATPARRRRRRRACRFGSKARRAATRQCPACDRRRRASADRSRPAVPRGAPCGRRARTDGRMCAPEFPGTHSTSN